MPRPLRILLVEDSEDDATLLIRELKRQEYDPVWRRVDTEAGMREALSDGSWDLVISDFALPHFGGFRALESLKASGLDLPFICVSGTIGEDTAVAIMKAGAHDYIMKGNLRRLAPAIERELRDAQVRDERARAQRAEQDMLEELRRSNEELERFAYVASHDLQEPLRMVATYTELLAKRYRSQLPPDPDLDAFIGYTLEGAYRMRQLINDLLTISRLNSRERRFVRTDCERALKAALFNLRVTSEEAGAEITHGELPAILGDEGQITLVFQNLIGNAIKFRSGSAPRIRIDAVVAEGTACISVADNGIGIDPRHADQVFVIFKRLHGREKYPGTGIGLALCKKIVEQHGGRIWVEPAPVEGSIFRFTLPLSAGTSARAPSMAGDMRGDSPENSARD